MTVTVPAQDHAPQVLSRDPGAFAMPTGREEEWRFTPIDRLAALLVDEASASSLAWEVDLPEGVTMDVVAAGDPALSQRPLPVDRISAIALANAADAVRLVVAADARPDRAAIVRLNGAGGVVHGHVLIDVQPGAEATVVLDHRGTADYAEHLSVSVADASRLTLIHVQDWNSDAVHAAHVAFRVGRDATVRSLQVSLGGSLVRVVETVDYAGPGGDAELSGLYFADSGQHLEHRLFVDHAVPHCRSNVIYKGALQGAAARTVWIGDVLIRAAAKGTDTYEINRNLVLTDGARADSVPNLEIETGEVAGAGHASATGRFDDEQLFYLQSRGIEAEEARRLVVQGFFAELLQRIADDELRDRLMASVNGRLTAGS